jgi:tetratricopeptide (TPR) repeat protein
LREALAVLDPAAHPFETANALATEARFHHLAGKHKSAIELLKTAAELVRPTAQAESIDTLAGPLIAQVYAWTAGAHQHYGLYSDGDAWARCAIDFGTRHNILFAQAVGHEFLGENAAHAGNYEWGLECGEQERAIAERLRSRERMAWMHFYTAHCHLALGHLEQSENSFLTGIGLAEAIGEKRVLALLRSNYAVLLARLGRHDEALAAADESMRAQADGLLYMRFEGMRCLADVRLTRARAQESSAMVKAELDEAERLCSEAAALIEPTESRVSKLWLGPLHMDVLLEQTKLAKSEGDQETGKEKFAEAERLLTAYQELVAQCQSPRFSGEAKRLSNLIGDIQDRSNRSR